MRRAKIMRIKWNIYCKIFGHKWDKSDPYDQHCKRCPAERMLMYQKYHSAGENPYSWKIML